MTQVSNQTSAISPEYRLYAEFDVDPALGLGFVDALLLNPPSDMSVAEYVDLMGWRRGLAEAAPSANKGSVPGLPVRGRTLIGAACQLASKANADWLNRVVNALTMPTGAQLEDEIWKALFGWTNIGGTASQGVLFLDSLLHSVPLNWRVKLQGGQWELYDANASARRHAFGKAAKLKYPPRMKLRARGASLKWVPGGKTSGGAVRIAANGAKSVGEALKIAQVNKMKLIPKVAHNRLPLPGWLGGGLLGAALTFGPQLVSDASDAGLFSDATSGANWRKFAVNTASNQTANAVGMGVAFLAAGAVAAAGAPVIIFVGIAAGAGGQALFNAFGMSKACGEAVDGLIGYLSS